MPTRPVTSYYLDFHLLSAYNIHKKQEEISMKRTFLLLVLLCLLPIHALA